MNQVLQHLKKPNITVPKRLSSTLKNLLFITLSLSFTLIIFSLFTVLTPAQSLSPDQVKQPVQRFSSTEIEQQKVLTPATNIACLPFPEPTITSFNGQAISGPYNSDGTQTFITWKDGSDTETGYRIERQKIGENIWVTLDDTLPPNSYTYTDIGLATTDDYLYRVVALQDNLESTNNPTCRRPKFVEKQIDGESQAYFRVFYRPYASNKNAECPKIKEDDDDIEEMCSTKDTAERMAETLERSRLSLIDLGFSDPVSAVPMPIDITLCDGGGCARVNNGTTFLGLRPASVKTPFNPVTYSGTGSFWIPLHETFHKVQGGLKAPNKGWVTEGQARSIEDKVCLDPLPHNPNQDCTMSTDFAMGGAYTFDVNNYLADPNRSLVDLGKVGYQATLFWTYIAEQYGNTTKEPQLGMDIISGFWQVIKDWGMQDPPKLAYDSLEVIDEVLKPQNVTFEDVFKKFIVANYAKDLPNAPAHYRYIDETQPVINPVKYNSVIPSIDKSLTAGEQYILPDNGGLNAISRWGARYYRLVPDASVETIHIEAQTYAKNTIYYTLLSIKNGTIEGEINQTSSIFNATIDNIDLDEVVLVVAGLEQDANIALSVNGTEPVLQIVDPLTNRPALAGDPDKPRKIMVKVEVLSPQGGGTPLTGLALDKFTITVGDQIVPPNQMISTAYIQGEYWMVLRAPTQTNASLYDLNVDYNTTLSDTVEQGVSYSPGDYQTDNILIIDRSGSMADFQKLDAAQDAARLYVDSWQEGDQVGLISYAASATLDYLLSSWTETSRAEIHTKIDTLNADGLTAIGAAMIKALDEFEARGRNDPNIPRTMILLSDGAETVEEPPLIADFVAAYQAITITSKLPNVHIIALGADADQAALTQLAKDVDGTYHFAAEPDGALKGLAGGDARNELAELYRIIGETIVKEQQIYSAQDILSYSNNNLSHTIRVDGSASEATFAINWYYTDEVVPLNIRLKKPDGTFVAAPTLTDNEHQIWRIPTPDEGDWQVLISPVVPGRQTTSAKSVFEAKLLVEASLKSDLTIDAFLGLAIEDRLVNKPMPIFVSLSDNLPLVDSTVIAEITDPSGNLIMRPLFDDGLHNDGAADDGFYGNIFYQTNQPGVYQVIIHANGTSPLNGDFNRRVRIAFYMAAGEDDDDDGLATHWEIDQGTDPTVPDSDQDPDGDGLTTREEYIYNTHPFNPDTDNGGESDGSEVRRGSDPHEPADDNISPPRWKVSPGVQKNMLRFTLKPDYYELRILRATDPDGPYQEITTLSLTDTVENSWLDLNVNNDQEYCYRLIALGRSGAESGTLNVDCSTPKMDPFSPFVLVEINNNTFSTTLQTPQTVMLTLDVADTPADFEFDVEEDLGEQQGSLYLDHISSGAAEMLISNQSHFPNAVWEPFQPETTWVLEPVNNIGTVYVKVRDAAGNESDSGVASILIEENTTPLYQLYIPLILR